MNHANRMAGLELSIIRQINALATSSSINLGMGDLPFDAPKVLLNEFGKPLAPEKTKYTPNQGLLLLREAIAKDVLDSTGKEVSLTNIIVTNGVTGALFNLFYAFVDLGDEVLIPEIGFSLYESHTKLHGGKPVLYKLTPDFGIDFDSLKSNLSSKTKFILINTPHNPTGRVLKPNELKNLAELVENHPIAQIVSDEIYDVVYVGAQPTSMREYTDRAIVVNGISKRFGASGLRIGWAIADEKFIQKMTIVNQQTATCANTPAQYATAYALLQGKEEVKTYEGDLRAVLKRNLDLTLGVLRGINGISTVVPEGAFYVFPNISAYGTSMDVAKKIIADKNVITIPGIAFGPAGEGYLRISYAQKREVLEEGLLKLSDVLKK